MAELYNVLSRLSQIFRKIDIDYVIVGGIAVIHYGHLRTTQDIDILIENDPSKLNQFFKQLKDFNFDVMDEQVELGLKEQTNITIFDNKSFLRLDIRVITKVPERDVLNAALSQEIMGINLKIAPLEYVLLGKIIFLGNIYDKSDSELFEYQDVIDFLTLFHANREIIDLEFLKEKSLKYRLRKTLNRLLKIKL